MRIHHDSLTVVDLYDAARVARVELRFSTHNSRSRGHAYEVTLRGESRRRPNFYDGDGTYAATWDQWGVFLAVLFDRDDAMICGSAKRPTYANRADFNYKTGYRFEPGFWPADAHGDHRFTFQGVPREQECTKCSAAQRWS